MRAPALLLLTAAPLIAAASRAGEPVPLARKLEVGARVRVDERARTETQVLVRGKGASVGESEVSELTRRYLEEVRTARPEGLWREFELSTRAKARRGAPLPEPERTSLHGRAVVLSGLEMKPDGAFEISKEDREALRLDRLALALLPPGGSAEKGGEWTVPAAALGRALFGDWVPEANLQGSGARVELKALKRESKRDVARLRVKALRLQLAKTDALPGLTLTLEGELGFDLQAGCLVSASLEGPLEYVVGGNDAEATAQGSLAWSYRAEVLERRAPSSDEARAQGDPPPPGTQRLVCKKEATHVYPVPDVKCCVMCGKELNRDKVCPEHGWPLRFCPRDGAPLRPE